MARTFAEIDLSKPIYITNARHQLDRPMLEFVSASDRIELTAAEGALLIKWLGQSRWRPLIEADLQCHSQDGKTGEPLLTAEIPLVTFREHLCAGGRHIQDAETAELFDRLRALMRGWRDDGGDTVSLDGYLLAPEEAAAQVDGARGLRGLPNVAGPLPQEGGRAAAAYEIAAAGHQATATAKAEKGVRWEWVLLGTLLVLSLLSLFAVVLRDFGFR